ncbi:hypothetical protein AB0M54_00285 [Actinoplanes sp. NPDC051470]|uniref:hypothetical protein n=1 Tax=unclassified Actinoplanes TaxID=2626549 RepID=UPI00341FC3AE
MTGEPTVVAGRVARWVLLACTLFGLAAMHTLGHAGMRMHEHASHGPATLTVAPAVMMGDTALAAAAAGAVDDCPGCPHAAGSAGGHGGMGGWGVCLAVLSGLAMLVLLAVLLLARSRAGGARVRSSGSRLRVPRGPPPRRAGLTLAAVSVLRI